jgi:molecular chaperone GrpE (heat shock protein)
MSESSSPKVVKWPFLLGDFSLLAIAAVVAWLAHTGQLEWSLGLAAILVAGVGIGAWILITPFLRDQEAAAQSQEQAGLADTLAQIKHLESIAHSVTAATTNLAVSQRSLEQANEAARTLVGVMHDERTTFTEAMQRRDEQERQTLKLELEKLRRGEDESLRVILHLLDHGYALLQAAHRSGQPGLIHQLGQYRAACLDAVRRLGIVAHEATPGDGFNPGFHQVVEGPAPAEGTRIAGTVACGYTWRSQPVRPILVAVEGAAVGAAEGEPAVAAAGEVGEEAGGS